MSSPPPLPEAVQRFALPGRPYKARLERLLAEIAQDDAEELLMLLKEGRGAYGLLLGAGTGARVLFVGDARSGTPIALAMLGLDVTVVARCRIALTLARTRAAALAPDRIRFVHARVHGGARLPFRKGAFDVCVQEPGGDGRTTLEPSELWRVARYEVFDVRDNRFAYKRSLGRRGAFDKSPLAFARTALRPRAGERSLRAARSAVGCAGAARVEAFALYPHAREFSHVVALDAAHPGLTIGPRERKNRLKMAAYRAGFFRTFTPSFGVHGRRIGAASPSRLERIVRGVAERLGTAVPTIETFVATRSNNALILTGGAARWALHVPLQPSKRHLVGVHHDWLVRVRARHPDLPVPEPHFLGEVEGVFLSVEERLDGLSGTEVTGDDGRTARLLVTTAHAFSRLVGSEATTVDATVWDELMGERVARVLRLVPDEATRAAFAARADRLRAHVLGRSYRLATYHADLRGKHVVTDPDGSFRAALDWGASEHRFFPLVDVLQLVVHQRKQETGRSFGDAWRALLDPDARRPAERAAFADYAERTGLGPDDVEAFLAAFPVFVAGMAERNWDFSRPHWVARQFALAGTE